MNALRHPNIVDVEDLSTEGELHYLVMELLEGETLGARLEREKRLALPAVLDVIRPVSSALAAAHARGMVHRDLKPENVFLARDERGNELTKLLDFGIVKLHEPGPRANGARTTQAGMLLGTPAYMSPEQCCASDTIDARSDVYSLGVVVYEALSGRLPFVRSHVLGLLAAHQFDAPVPLARAEPSVPPAVSDVVMHALQKSAADRPETIVVFAEALERAMLGKPSSVPEIRSAPPLEVQRLQTRNVGGKLADIVGKRISSGTLNIPSMPETCLHCMEILRQPRVRIPELADRVRRDPLLSARLLTLAGSSALGSREKVVDVDVALVRVGIEACRGIVVEMAARQVFVSRDPRLRARLRSIWERSLAVGTAASLLATAVGSPIARGAAHSAGLVSEIGHPILAALLLDVERASGSQGGVQGASSWVTDEVFAAVVAEHGRSVGARAAAEWRLPPELEGPIANHDTWDEPGGIASIRDLVRVGGLLATLAGHPVVGESAVDPVALEMGRARLGLSGDDEAKIVLQIPALVLAQVGGTPRAATRNEPVGDVRSTRVVRGKTSIAKALP